MPQSVKEPDAFPVRFRRRELSESSYWPYLGTPFGDTIWGHQPNVVGHLLNMPQSVKEPDAFPVRFRRRELSESSY